METDKLMDKLYSILLSKGKERLIYIDLTELEVNVKKDKYNEHHCIIVEQEQDKGIQIIIKS
jgi:hypothetical protein